jgi:carboxymethylenebutenolidase
MKKTLAAMNETVPKSQELMKAAGRTYEPAPYEDAGHGFMRAGEDPANTNEANKKARDQAWGRVKEILAKL